MSSRPLSSFSYVTSSDLSRSNRLRKNVIPTHAWVVIALHFLGFTKWTRWSIRRITIELFEKRTSTFSHDRVLLFSIWFSPYLFFFFFFGYSCNVWQTRRETSVCKLENCGLSKRYERRECCIDKIHCSPTNNWHIWIRFLLLYYVLRLEALEIIPIFWQYVFPLSSFACSHAECCATFFTVISHRSLLRLLTHTHFKMII